MVYLSIQILSSATINLLFQAVEAVETVKTVEFVISGFAAHKKALQRVYD
jgi:hypothetical protein